MTYLQEAGDANPRATGESTKVCSYSSNQLFFGLIWSHFPLSQKVPTSNTEGGWSYSLAEFIRHNDMPIHEAADKALKTFQEEFMPVETFSEFLDVAGKCVCAFPFIGCLMQLVTAACWRQQHS